MPSHEPESTTSEPSPSHQRSATLAGRKVLVTGAAGGIGRAICRHLAELGATIGIHYHRGAERARDLLQDLPGEGHVLLAADLRDPDAVREMVDRAAEQLSGLDVLVSNAGIFERHPPQEVSYEEWQQRWQKTLSVNLVAPANAAYCCLPHFARRGGGRIIHIGSRGASRGEPENPAYGASKAGLHSFSQSMALALGGQGVFVYAIAPGFVETAMARPYLTGEMAEAIRQQSPLGRVARAQDVAYWVGCLAADGAEFATGTIIDVNGASYLRS